MTENTMTITETLEKAKQFGKDFQITSGLSYAAPIQDKDFIAFVDTLNAARQESRISYTNQFFYDNWIFGFMDSYRARNGGKNEKY